jgi:hypothetical protein
MAYVRRIGLAARVKRSLEGQGRPVLHRLQLRRGCSSVDEATNGAQVRDHHRGAPAEHRVRPGGSAARFRVVSLEGATVLGGSTFVVRRP